MDLIEMSPRNVETTNLSPRNAAVKSNNILNEEQLKEFTYILIKNLEAKKISSEGFIVILLLIKVTFEENANNLDNLLKKLAKTISDILNL